MYDNELEIKKISEDIKYLYGKTEQIMGIIINMQPKEYLVSLISEDIKSKE